MIKDVYRSIQRARIFFFALLIHSECSAHVISKYSNFIPGCSATAAYSTVVLSARVCKWGSGLLKSRLCFLTSKNHKQDYKQRGTTTWG